MSGHELSAPTGSNKRIPLFKREERHEFRYQLSVFLAEFFSWVFWLIPGPVRYFIADRVGDMFRRMTHTYRDNVESNVAQVMGMKPGSEDVQKVVASIFRTSARNFTDLVTMPRRSRSALLGSLEISNGTWQPIDDAIAQGKGVMFVTGHVGCFDLVGQVLWARGYKLTIVTGRTTSRFIFDGVTHLRASKGMLLVEPTPSGIRNVIKRLRQGECAVFVSDRDFFQTGREVEFFGRLTTLPPGAVRIARDTGAIVVPIVPHRHKTRHQLEILTPFTVDKTPDLEADMQAGFAKLVPALEHAIRHAVSQWVMFQRVWPETPAPPIRVFPIGSPLESELLEKVAQALPERPKGNRRSVLRRLTRNRGEGDEHDATTP
jgi:KDO2-lipid IV(A) lauroyltransferase